METAWIIEQGILEEITFCNKGLVDSLYRMVVGLNFGMIYVHWHRLLPFTDNQKREVKLFSFNWQALNLCRSLLVISNILAWLSCSREFNVRNDIRRLYNRRMIWLYGAVMRSSLLKKCSMQSFSLLFCISLKSALSYSLCLWDKIAQ